MSDDSIKEILEDIGKKRNLVINFVLKELELEKEF
jgi:hypothetical protein